jgi:hypothetical protein
MKPESDGEVIVDERLHRLLTQALAEYNDSGSSARIERLLVMTRPLTSTRERSLTRAT